MHGTPLFVVDDAFQILGRGCVLVPGPPAEPGSQEVRVGDRILLVLPDGATIETEIRGLEMINYRRRPTAITAPIMLPREITKDQVPAGTQVFLVGGRSSAGGRDA